MDCYKISCIITQFSLPFFGETKTRTTKLVTLTLRVHILRCIRKNWWQYLQPFLKWNCRNISHLLFLLRVFWIRSHEFFLEYIYNLPLAKCMAMLKRCSKLIILYKSTLHPIIMDFKLSNKKHHTSEKAKISYQLHQNCAKLF